jgi:hypothetical protein
VVTVVTVVTVKVVGARQSHYGKIWCCKKKWVRITTQPRKTSLFVSLFVVVELVGNN